MSTNYFNLKHNLEVLLNVAKRKKGNRKCEYIILMYKYKATRIKILYTVKNTYQLASKKVQQHK